MSTSAIHTSSHLASTDRVLSLPECSAISNLSIDTLKRAGERGEINILELSPRRRGIWLSELNRYINARAAERG